MPDDKYNNDFRKHLDFIQNSIARLNANSFLIKGWTITLIAALFAFTATTKNSNLLFISIIPVLGFWALDSIYLMHEKRFRSLYNLIITEAKENEEKIDIPLYTINPRLPVIIADKKNGYFHTFTSKSVLAFYGFLLGITIGTAVYFKICDTSANPIPPVKVEINDTLYHKNIDKAELVKEPNPIGKKN